MKEELKKHTSLNIKVMEKKGKISNWSCRSYSYEGAEKDEVRYYLLLHGGSKVKLDFRIA